MCHISKSGCHCNRCPGLEKKTNLFVAKSSVRSWKALVIFLCFHLLDFQLQCNMFSANIFRKQWKLITLVWQLRWRALAAAERCLCDCTKQRMRLKQPVSLHTSQRASFSCLRVNSGIPLLRWILTIHANEDGLSSMFKRNSMKPFIFLPIL